MISVFQLFSQISYAASPIVPLVVGIDSANVETSSRAFASSAGLLLAPKSSCTSGYVSTAVFPLAMLATTPQSDDELAHISSLPHAACGQFHMSLFTLNPVLGSVHPAFKAVESNFG